MPWLDREAVDAGFQTSRVEMRYTHARTIQVAPRFGEIRFQTFSLSVNPGSPNAPMHKQADRGSA